MKKLMTTLVAIATVTIISCSKGLDSENQEISNTTKSSQLLILNAIASETGYVTAFSANTLADGSALNPLKMGVSDFTNHASIFTFDTSTIPTNATVVQANLRIGAVVDGYPDWQFTYLFDNTQVDFAGPYGFGGNAWWPSFTITSGDYYAIAAKSYQTIIANGAAGGLMLELDKQQKRRDINTYINKTGKTQIRLKLFNNPSNALYKIYAFENQPIQLFVVYEITE